MFDSKFIFTLVGLIVAVLAICKFNIGNTSEQFMGINKMKSVAKDMRPYHNHATQAMRNRETRSGKSFCHNNISFVSDPEYKQAGTATANLNKGLSTTTYHGKKASGADMANQVENFFMPGSSPEEYSGEYASMNTSGPVVTGEYAGTTFGANAGPQSLPAGNMSDPSMEVDLATGQVVTYTRQVYANQGGRNRDKGDPIRGDLPIVPRQGDWFVPSANPQLDLRRGGANMLFGATEAGNKLNELITVSSNGTDTTVGGANVAGLYDISMAEPIMGPDVVSIL